METYYSNNGEVIDALAYNFFQDMHEVVTNRFKERLEEHFAKDGPLVIGAPKAGGEVFVDDGFAANVGEFVFTHIERNLNGEGIDEISGYITGPLGQVFDAEGGLGFEFCITTQGHTRERIIDAWRQIRGVWATHCLDDLDDNQLRALEDAWKLRSTSN